MTHRIKVLWLIKGLGVGGAEQLLVNSLPHLDRDRFSYQVAYFLPGKDHLVSSFRQADVPVSCLDGRHPYDLRVVGRLRRLLETRRIDILDAHLPYSGVVGRVAGRLARTPVRIYTEHSLAVQRRLSRLRFLGFLANVLTYPLNDLVVSVSADTHRDVQRFNFGRTPTRLVYNGIPLEAFQDPAVDVGATRRTLGIPSGHRVVGHVAKMVSKKRQEDLLRAAGMVLQRRSDVTFVLVGDGELRPRLEELADELGIRANVVFAGYVDSVVDVLATFDVFTLSSLYEGLPTVVIEAMALGVPVVATRVGGASEIVTDRADGLLTPPRDPRALAMGILRLLGDEPLRRAMGERARASVRERFDMPRRVREMEELYLELLASRQEAHV